MIPDKVYLIMANENDPSGAWKDVHMVYFNKEKAEKWVAEANERLKARKDYGCSYSLDEMDIIDAISLETEDILHQIREMKA